MKRIPFLVVLALAYCLAPSAGFGQGWVPGPPPSATPYPDVSMPLLGQPGPMANMNPGCSPMPPCGPMPCGPSRPASIAGLVGWQFGSDPGGVKFSTREHRLLARAGTHLDFDLSGLWLGVSGRMQPSDGLSLRGEYRHFFPSEEHVRDTTTYVFATDTTARTFKRSNFQWNVLDGSAGLNIACGASLVGGLRWDSFQVSLRHAPLIPFLSSAEDEGDLTLSAIIPYGGAEFAWNGCEWGALLRVIGTPWMTTWTKYGLTYGNGGFNFRGPIRDHLNVSSKYASFVEATLIIGKKISCNFTASGFGMITSINAHSEGTMNSTLLEGAIDDIALFPGAHRSAKFDVDMYRWTFILGGNVAVGFNSPM